MKNRATVFQLATEVRAWALNQAGVYETDLCGWCGICSAELWRRLKKAGIVSKIHMHQCTGLSHVFLVVEDHIVDVTATQFTELYDKPIVIMPEFEGKGFDFYESTEEFNTAEELRKHQLRTKWPRMQVAFKR